jgi:hypothetical protein
MRDGEFDGTSAGRYVDSWRLKGSEKSEKQIPRGLKSARDDKKG